MVVVKTKRLKSAKAINLLNGLFYESFVADVCILVDAIEIAFDCLTV